MPSTNVYSAISAALANAKPSARRCFSAAPGRSSPTAATPSVIALIPSHADADNASPISAALPAATSTGAQPRITGYVNASSPCR
jgi:hypothetical protein